MHLIRALGIVALVLLAAAPGRPARAAESPAVHNEGQSIVIDFGHPNPVPRTLGESGSVYIPPQLVGTSYLLNGDVLDEAVGRCLAQDCSVIQLYWGSDLLQDGAAYSLTFTYQLTTEDLGSFVATGLGGGKPQLVAASGTQRSLTIAFDRPMLHGVYSPGGLRAIPGAFDSPRTYDSPDEEYFAALRLGGTATLDEDATTVTFGLWNAVAAGTYLLQVPAMYDATGVLSDPTVVEVSFEDEDPPALREAMAGPSGTRSIVLAFTEPMDPETATDMTHYRYSKRVLTTQGDPVPFPEGTTAACTFIGCTYVTITYPPGYFQACYDEPMPAPAYAVIVSGVVDRAGRAMETDPATTRDLCLGRDTRS